MNELAYIFVRVVTLGSDLLLLQTTGENLTCTRGPRRWSILLKSSKEMTGRECYLGSDLSVWWHCCTSE